MTSYYKVLVRIPRQLTLPGDFSQSVDRQLFYDWLWQVFSEKGLEGINEGTLLSEQAVLEGFEVDSWTVDSAEAPKNRDWIENQSEIEAELYFASEDQAKDAIHLLEQVPELKIGDLLEEKPQDWDAQWKASFLNQGEGVLVSPFWRIVPPWVEQNTVSDQKILKINPGAGFGTGTHETTQLCLSAIGEFSKGFPLESHQALDFGSGSGILSIAMAILGAKVDAIEVDSLAIDNASENAEMNQVQDRIQFHSSFPEEKKTYRLVVANILRPVLMEFSETLVKSLSPEGVLILSGIIESDIPYLMERYKSLLGRYKVQIQAKGEWRALVFAKN